MAELRTVLFRDLRWLGEIPQGEERRGDANPIIVEDTGDGTYMVLDGMKRLGAELDAGANAMQCIMLDEDEAASFVQDMGPEDQEAAIEGLMYRVGLRGNGAVNG